MTSFTSNHKAIVVASTATLLVLWELTAHMVQKEILVPSIPLIVGEIYTIVTSLESLLTICTTLGRIILTFLLCLGLTLVLGIPAGLWKPLEQALKPLETAARSVPTMGVILLAIIWLGSEGTPVFVSLLIIFPILYRSLIEGIHSIDVQLVAFHQIHGVRFYKRLRHFYLPSVLPFLRAGSVASLGLCFKVIIAAEVLSQPQNAIGTIFQVERARLNTAGVMAWCILLIVLAALFEYFLRKIGKNGGVKS